MYAIIKTSGKQYKVEPGQEIEIDRIAGEVGAPVDFSDVLAISNDQSTTFGNSMRLPAIPYSRRLFQPSSWRLS